MNLIRIPKYKKYNDDLKPVRLASVPPKRIKQRYQPYSGGNPTIIPVKIDPYKPKRSKHVKIKDSLTSWYSRSIRNTEPKPKLTRFQRLFKKDDESFRCKLSEWYSKKKALRALKLERRKELQRIKKLEKWKRNEEHLVHQAQMEKLQAEREAEVAKQLWEIEKERARLTSNTLKTHYPYKVEKKTAQTDDTYQRYYNTDYEKKHDDAQHYYAKYYQKYNDVTPYVPYQEDLYEEPTPTTSKKFKKEKKIKLKREKPVKFKKVKQPKIKKVKQPKMKKEKPPKVKKVKPPKVKKEKPPKVKKQKAKKYEDYEEQYYYKEEPIKKEKKRKREKRHKAAKYKEVTIAERPRRRSLEEKFVNCFYKSCCELYCCLSIFILIGLVIIFIV